MKSGSDMAVLGNTSEVLFIFVEYKLIFFFFFFFIEVVSLIGNDECICYCKYIFIISQITVLLLFFFF